MDKCVAILGGGISGLSLAWYLKQQGLNPIIIEKENRVGGWIRTIEKEGFLFELGPHSIRPSFEGLATLRLIESLDLHSQVIQADAAARKRYLFIDQKLQCLPNNIFSFFLSPLTRGLIKDILHDLFAVSTQLPDESIYNFIARRFSPKIAERFVDPLISGIYAGNIHSLSISSCMPVLYHLEQQYGSVAKGLLKRKKQPETNDSDFVKGMLQSGIFSFKKGLSTLIEGLTHPLQQNIRLNRHVISLSFFPDHVILNLACGAVLKVDHLYSALPAHALSKVLRASHPQIADVLKRIESTSVASVSLGYRNQILPHKGFGYLVPSKEKEEILGMIWDSSVFPQQNNSFNETRLTVMMGGVYRQDICALQESERLHIALDAIKRHLCVKKLPDVVHHSLALNAIPQYNVGYKEVLNSVSTQLKGISERFGYLGTAFHGVSINDCIHQAEILAKSHE